MRAWENKIAFGDRMTWLTGLGLGLTITMQVTTLSSFDFMDPYAVITTISRLLALIGSYLAIVGLLLIARIPWVENSFGHDRLVVWHRKAMPFAILLITSHVLLVLLGSAGANQRIIANQLWEYLTSYEWMLAALVGFALLLAASITSYKRVRATIKYETWWSIHLYTYLGTALSFMHQILHGSMFVEHPLNQAYWTGLYIFVGFAIITWRVLLPLYRSIRHQLRVKKIVRESEDSYSIYISGKDLGLLHAQGGQFFNWRFLTREKWYENHPFSLSATPRSDQLRITIRKLGDATSHLDRLQIGTRVMIEGPYGIFSKESVTQDSHVVLIAGGVGITPLRALIDDLPQHTRIDLIYRIRSSDDLILGDELFALERSGRIKLHLMIGSRDQHPINAVTLDNLIPGFHKADIFVCGPESLVESVKILCKESGIEPSKFHHEFFEYHSTLGAGVK